MSKNKAKEKTLQNTPSARRRFFTEKSNWGWPLLSGILLILIQPPVSLSTVAFFALIPFLGSIRKENLRYSFFAGYVTGFISYLGLIYWVIVAMHGYGGIDIFLSTVILILFCLYLSLYTGMVSFGCAFLEKRFSTPLYFSVPLMWVLMEYLRGWLLTGFPWSYLAHSQYNFLPIIQVVSITGTYFISFLIVAVNAIFYSFWRKERISVAYAGIVAVFFCATLLYGSLTLSMKDEKPLKKVAIIQGNIRQDIKWDESFQTTTINKYLRMTRDSGKGTDLVIWPETALPLLFAGETDVNRHVRELSQALGSNLLFGTLSRDGQGRIYNSAYMIGRAGETVGVYNKAHLVPFGEYTPLVSSFPFLAKLTATGAGFHPGDGHKPIPSDIGKVGLLICFEGVFPSVTAQTVREGAQVLVNLTNDAWYDRTSAAFQHFAFYIFRAIETDRYVLRAANTGVSAVIDPKGRVQAKTPIFTEETLKGDFAVRDGMTFYVKYGDYFILIALLALAGAIAMGYRNRLRPIAEGGKSDP